MYGNKYTDEKGKEHKNSMKEERYVYYQRLDTDTGDPIQEARWRSLFAHATNVMKYRAEEGSNAEKIAEYFRKLRDAEYKKERNLLREKFGQQYYMQNYRYSNDEHGETPGIAEKLIEAFNTVFNLKDIFERNLRLVRETGGKESEVEYYDGSTTTGTQKSVTTFFPYYFDEQLTEKQSEIAQDILNGIAGKPDVEFEKIVSSVVNNWIPKIVREALIYMYEKAKTESGIKTDRERLQKAYSELLPFLKDINNKMGNEFIQSFVETYKLNEVADSIAKSITIDKKKKKVGDIDKIKVMGKDFHSKGGVAKENLLDFVAKVANNVDGLKLFSSTHTGGSGQKADVIFTINIPMDTISKWLEENSFGDRGQNIEAVQKLQKQLNEFKKGFIVYTNAKDYTLRGTKGYSAGEAISLDTWDTMMHKANKKGRDLIFMAMQVIPKAVGEDYLEKTRTTFARAIAAALFDDFDTVGFVPKESVQSIHLMYLNGFYIPLSFYFNLLYKAFHDYAGENLRQVIEVNITKPKEIAFPKMEDQIAWQEKTGKNPWTYQADIALRQIKISYHFLKNYKEILQRLNFKF